MRTVKFLVKISFAGLLFLNMTRCDEEVKILEGPKPDSEALFNWFNESGDNNEQHFSINSSTGGNVTGSKGTTLQFSPNAFSTLSGDAVTGNVDIELIEIYDRATMLVTNRPTNGKWENNSIKTLVSGGEFYVNATQNGNQLKPKTNFTIVAPTENTGEIDQDMRRFTGVAACASDSCNIIWEEDDNKGIEIGEFQVTGGFKTAYYVYQSKFGWTNIDRWYNDPRPKTTIFVDVPDGFDNTNCAVFVTYDGESTALASFDIYDKDKKLFAEHYGLIPVGLKVHFILISIIDEEIHYAIQPATITENHVAVINAVESITEEELINLIDDLP
jgi:hypothetical protein